MQKRRLGRTEQRSTVVTFGAFSVGYLDQEEADRVIEMVLGHGVNHIDIAPSYGEAMERMAPWMPEIRDRMFLGSKTRFRSRDVESILKRMNVEEFDLFQLHSVGDLHELELATADGGALAALVEMREQGLTRWIGITGHGPQVPGGNVVGEVRDPTAHSGRRPKNTRLTRWKHGRHFSADRSALPVSTGEKGWKRCAIGSSKSAPKCARMCAIGSPKSTRTR